MAADDILLTRERAWPFTAALSSDVRHAMSRERAYAKRRCRGAVYRNRLWRTSYALLMY